MKKVPKISGAFLGNCCQACSNILKKNTYERVYQEEFFNKTILQQLLINKSNI